MSLTITEKAAQEVKKFIEDGDYEGVPVLRVGISGGGCSGFNYVFNIATDFDPANDTKMDQHGVDVVVDKKSALFLDGTTVDYVDGIEGRGFKFHNPNAKRTCGCGNSFGV